MDGQIVPDLTGEVIKNLGDGPEKAFVSKATDPVISPNYSTPADFAAQYPTPLDPTEIIAMCEEISAWLALPEEFTSLKQHTWRELNELAFTSGSAYIAFADGYCPEEFAHDGDNATITLKNLGAKKSLGISDIMHSAAVAAANWNGINRLIGPAPWGQGVPGGSSEGTFEQEYIADLKEKEVRLAMTLVLNGWDQMLVTGNAGGDALSFSGIETLVATTCAHYYADTASGTFSASSFDRFLSEGCAKPTSIWGHPAAIQELLMAYFSLAFQGSQLVQFNTGDRIVPGFNFSGAVNTGIGRLNVVADENFTRTAAGANLFRSDLFALRMRHNGVPLVYKLTQIPLALKDLVPGCTAIAFEVWVKTALIVKYCCAHHRYRTFFTGRIVTTCPVIG